MQQALILELFIVIKLNIMKYKFRIKEKVSQFGTKRYYPQYKRFLFWHYEDPNIMDIILKYQNPSLRCVLCCDYDRFAAYFTSFEDAKLAIMYIIKDKDTKTYKTSKNHNIN